MFLFGEAHKLRRYSGRFYEVFFDETWPFLFVTNELHTGSE